VRSSKMSSPTVLTELYSTRAKTANDVHRSKPAEQRGLGSCTLHVHRRRQVYQSNVNARMSSKLPTQFSCELTNSDGNWGEEPWNIDDVSKDATTEPRMVKVSGPYQVRASAVTDDSDLPCGCEPPSGIHRSGTGLESGVSNPLRETV